ncbi:MAG: hypothetical protein KF749_17570 [Bacteroidetes bacterium]|nr:hypothetical protein [Bacteroidota bacterium]MCW5894142.1 hypothetical protein [Bacteroidota bacterium]
MHWQYNKHSTVQPPPALQSGQTLVPYTTLLRQFNTAPPGKLYCLHGDRSVFRLSLYAASHALLAGVPIALVDGTNRFDAYYIAEFARKVTSQRPARQRVTPEQLLERIFISRAFTCYQMEATITQRLPAFVRKKQCPIVIIFGLLDTFYDEQAPLFEVKASIQRVIAALHKLKQGNISVLLASLDMKLASNERNALFPKLRLAMDEVYRAVDTDSGQRIVCETRNVSMKVLPQRTQK